MSVTIRYTGPKAEKLQSALADALAWLPPQGAKDLGAHLRYTTLKDGPRAAFRQGYQWLSFAGVRGLPARAFIRHAITELTTRPRTRA